MVPSLSNYFMNTILLDKLFNSNLDNNTNKTSIIKLINILTPNRTDYNPDIFTLDNKNIEFDQEPPIPPQILESNSIFWNYFYEHRQSITKLIEDNDLTYLNDKIDQDGSVLSLRIFDEYPQLFKFNFRYKLFYNKIREEMDCNDTFHLLIDRQNILESSYDQLKSRNKECWKKNFKIQYIGENGLDFGGLRRDWFTRLSRAIFNTDLGLFSLSDNMTYQPSITSYANPNHLQLFKFAGAIVAKAIIQQEQLDVELTQAFLYNILDRGTNLNNMKEIDETVYNSLQFILNNDLTEYEGLDINFSIEHNNFGHYRTYEFIENGSQISVTNENKVDFINYMVKYYSITSIECQIQAFCEGFDSLIKYCYLHLFSPIEFGLLISGKSVIDVNEIRKNAVYENPYTYNSPTIVLFFNSIAKWNQSDLEKLLLFITGCPKVPINGQRPIKIQPGGDKTHLPCSHTCFNILCLPYYENEEELNFKLMQAINNDDSFHLQ